MSLMFEPLRKYATFAGRARRKEYWLWQLFMGVLFSALYMWLFSTLSTLGNAGVTDLDAVMVTPAARLPLSAIGIAGLALFLPSLAVQVRRLHDSDKSGWWVLLGLTGIGSLILLILNLIDGTHGPNQHGADPKGRAPLKIG